MCNIRLLILVIIIISCHLIDCMWSIPRINVNLHEGDPCILENGDRGVCKKVPECPSMLKPVQDGKRIWTSRRCRLNNFPQIVCCSVNVRQKIALRPAEAACQQTREQHHYRGPLIPKWLYEPVYIHKVNGGQPVLLGQYEDSKTSYMVALGYTNKDPGEDESRITYKCGGSLISKQYVLTAAHCVNNIHGMIPVEVCLGKVNLLDCEGQGIPINNIISHPLYRPSKSYNDVAILKLKFEVNISYGVKPICLETKSIATVSITPSTSLVVLGWGATSFGDVDSSDQLLQTPSLSLVNNKECNKSYTNFSRKLLHGIDDSMICAKDADTVRMADACSGDSGGPLVMSTVFGDRVIGVAAFGHGCGSDIPGVHTAVYPFLDWIEEQVWPTTDSF